MFESPERMQSDFLRPLVDVWKKRIESAKAAKLPFQRTAAQCLAFFDAEAGFMFSDEHQKQFFGGKLPRPKFRVTVALPYEYVSIYGPHLFWDYASRKVISQKTFRVRQEMFGDENDPSAVRAFMDAQEAERKDDIATGISNEMLESYLNFSQREQPSGVVSHANMAITEALVKGAGLMFTQAYSFPGSTDTFTRNVYGTVDDLYIDPDCRCPFLSTAGYVVYRHVQPVWEVERKFNLPAYSLDGKGTHRSVESVSMDSANGGPVKTETFDLIEWYEIWSRVGIGPRSKSMSHKMVSQFDEVVGDIGYLCISPNVDFPLNAPAEKFFSGSAGDGMATNEEVADLFEWRCMGYGKQFPSWMDSRWPFAMLAFQRRTNSPWPIPPLANGLGELIAINILTSVHLDMVWANRKQIIAYLRSMTNAVKEAIEGDDLFSTVEINDASMSSIDKAVQFLNRPQSAAKSDVLEAIAKLKSDFYQRVGLNDLMYGNSDTQIRVAADIRERTASSNIRPEKMSGDVAAWATEWSQLEMFCAILHVDGASIRHLVGEFGASVWDSLVRATPPDRVMREMKASVEASEIRRPNKERDTANVQSLQQYITPLLQQYAMSTGDSGPLNSFIAMVGEAMEMPIDIQLGNWAPPSDPAAAQAQQEAQAAEIEQMRATAGEKAARAENLHVQSTIAAMNAGETVAGKLETDHQQQVRHKQENHEQGMIHEQEKFLQQIMMNEAEFRQLESRNEKTQGN